MEQSFTNRSQITMQSNNFAPNRKKKSLSSDRVMPMLTKMTESHNESHRSPRLHFLDSDSSATTTVNQLSKRISVIPTTNHKASLSLSAFHFHRSLFCAKMSEHCETWSKRRRRVLEEDRRSTATRLTGDKFQIRPTTTTTLSPFIFLSLLLLIIVQCIHQSTARHYIAPGPCTWTHMAPYVSRDIRLKSSSPSSSSPSSSLSSLSSLSALASSLSFSSSSSDLHLSSSPNDFDVSLKCSVSTLTPFTLNLSLIEPEHTVKLSIVCYGSSDSSSPADRSTLRQQHMNGLAPFEQLRVLDTLDIENCKFDRFPSDSFRGLVALKNLTIRNAILSAEEPLVIEPDSFHYVENHLEHLDLGFNRMQTLPTDLFCPFVTLRTLNLTRNNLLDLASFGLIDPATGRLCLQELQRLDLSHNQLEFVPETSGVAALKNLQVLNLSSNHISEIAELAFSALRQLHQLDLSGNRLRSLPGRMFRDSDELRELRLANNGLAELPSGLFIGLSKLLVLDISGNQISSETLTGDTFADLIRVVVLDLSGNRLRRLSANAFQNQYSLQVLSLEGNDLETIEEGAFSTLYNLHTLRLGRNRFRHLPDSVLSGLFVLHELLLAHNQLEHVHEDAFKNCSNLQKLDISDNRLTTLPIALRSLRSLRRINFSSNQLVSLTEPGPLTHTQHLEILDLSNNYLANVTRNALRPMANTLQELRLDGNRLRALEKNTLEDLRQTLRILRLDRNEFSDVSNALADVKQLEKLDILNVSHNHITWFDYALVPSGLRLLDLSANRIEVLGNYYELEAQLRLEDLDVSGNLIREIAASSIPNSIRSLNLSSNRIEKVDQFAFVAKHNVTFVDIRNNSLRRIDNNAFRLGVQRPTSSYFINRDSSEFDSKYLPPPIFLISGNPYYCDCTMEWLQRVNQLVGGVTGSGAISTYPRIGDLEEVQCELPFSRQASSSSLAKHQDPTSIKPNPIQVPLLQANSSNFLCRYRTHCFALCHCCEFDACDCEMMCPENCTCYYDQTWNTNIVDCSAANYRAVPPRIPMDVTSLYLDGNRLNSLNAHTFIGRKNLRVLHLNNSNLETIANRSFNGLVYLEELHLENNQLVALYGYEFEALHYLTTLHLDHNQISSIHDKTFAALRSLQVLRLNNNRLTVFGAWFTPSGFMPTSLSSSSMPATGMVQQRYLSASLSSNPWSCDCPSVTSLYQTLRQLSLQLHIVDAFEVRCINNSQSQTGPFLLRDLRQVENSIVDKCNLSTSMLPSSASSASSANSHSHNHNSPIDSRHPSPVSTFDNGQVNKVHIPVNNQEQNSLNENKPPLPDNFGIQPTNIENNSNRDDDEDTEISYQPLDLFAIKNRDQSSEFSKTLPDRTQSDIGNRNGPSTSRTGIEWNQMINSSVFIFMGFLILGCVCCTLLFLGFKRKQDIQLWFYGRYGVRLFESGFCGCRSSGDHRNHRGNGFNDHYVRDSEKLFDSFVIYAQPDESFVTQQLAAELECGYPPYRLCLRYRDLPAPSITTTDSNNVSNKDHGYAFDAVTQAIECSRRTLVVISENFLQSDWCKFELKAAHQETLSSCKTHRLIVVLVPSVQQQYQQMSGKMADLLLQRLDNETRSCIRGVTMLTWGERRFWEKLRFSMPPSSTTPVCSGDSVKGRTSTVVVTNSGYPTMVPSSLSSSSSLARSSVLYDTSQPIYYQHHYHYAQLPPSSNVSLHKSSSLSIFGSKQPLQPQAGIPNNNNNTATLSTRNPFCSKPLPPPPNQPLPPLPLVSQSHFISTQPQGQQLSEHHQQQQVPPTYATCSEYGEYETTTTAGESIVTSTPINRNNMASIRTLSGVSRTPHHHPHPNSQLQYYQHHTVGRRPQ